MLTPGENIQYTNKAPKYDWYTHFLKKVCLVLWLLSKEVELATSSNLRWGSLHFPLMLMPLGKAWINLILSISYGLIGGQTQFFSLSKVTILEKKKKKKKKRLQISWTPLNKLTFCYIPSMGKNPYSLFWDLYTYWSVFVIINWIFVLESNETYLGHSDLSSVCIVAELTVYSGCKHV